MKIQGRQFQLETFMQNDSQIGLSHLDIASSVIDKGKKSLEKKAAGKFYTPKEIGIPLTDSVSKHVGKKVNEISVIDPFCGDGRLLVWFLERMALLDIQFNLHLWDYDRFALKLAKANVSKTATRLGFNYSIQTKKTDTFKEFLKNDYEGKFDVVITNPPWDIVKPDKEELSHLNEHFKKEYVSSLKSFSNRLVNDYPTSKPEKMYGGWGVNLARVGVEVALRLAKSEAVVGIVSPASLLADQNSKNLRKWIFENNHCKEINYFPAESRLFSGVDLDSISMTVLKDKEQNGIIANTYSNGLNDKNKEKISIPPDFLKAIDYKIPISFGFHPKFINRLIMFHDLPTFENFGTMPGEVLWSGRELDETNYKSWLSTSGKHLFVKGRMIERFGITNNPTHYVNESIKSNIPESVNYHRVVWRDVSRPTQKRRIIATIIPPGWVTGNSLGVAYFKNNNLKKLKALLGIMSSLVFEFQVRSLLATSHISVSALRKARTPFADAELISELESLVEKRLEGATQIEPKIEILVAGAYNLSVEEFSDIVSAFPKIEDHYKQRLIEEYEGMNL